MAEEEIILSVNFDAEKSLDRMAEVIRRQNELREANKAYVRDAKEGNAVTAERTKEYIANVAELAKLKNEQKLLTAELGQSKQGFTDYGDSLDEMRRKLSDMQKAYDAMDATVRESASGQAFKQQMQEQYDAVLKLEEETGRHQRNVGNYPKIVTAIIPGFDKLNSIFAQFGVNLGDLAGKSTDTLKGVAGATSSAMGGVASATSSASATASGAFAKMAQSAKAFGTTLITPPIAVIVAVLSAILLVVNKVTEAIKKNDNAGTNLSKAFAVLQPIITAIGKAFDIFAEALTQVVLSLSKVVEFVAGGILSIVGLGDAYSEASKQAQALVQAQDDLQERERQFTENSAKWQRDIAELRAKVAEKDKYSVKERKEMLLQAIELEKQQLAEERAIAVERLRILKETAKQANDTSDEMKNKIAEMTAAVYKAEQKYYEGMRGLNRQVSQFDTDIQREEEQKRAEAQRKAEERRRRAEARAEKARAKAQEQARKRAEEERKRAEESARIEEEYTLKMLNLIEDATQRELAISTHKYQASKEQLDDRLKMWATESSEYAKLQQLKLQLDKDYDAEQDAIIAKNQARIDAEVAKRNAEYANELSEREAKRDRELQWAQEDATMDYERTELELEREIERLTALEELDEEHKAILFQSEEAYQQKVEETERNISRLTKQAIDERKANTLTTLSAVGDALGGLTQMMEAFGSKNKALAIASKTIALAQILIEQGVAIAKGIAQAQSVPFPANIGAIATTVSAILTGITSAVSAVKSAKFAGGGIVGGSNYYGDRVPAYLNSGEMVLNRQQQKQLFDIANSRVSTQQINYNELADALTTAIAQLPPPVMDYSEFTNFQDKTLTIKQLATL